MNLASEKYQGFKMKPRISIITLAVEDLKKSLSFYKEGLGLDNFTEGEDHIVFELNDELTLVLFLRAEFDVLADQSNTSTRFSGFSLSHSAESKEEVDIILEKARVAGGTLPNPPKEYDWGYSGYFKDLDGHLWEVVYFHKM